MSTAILPVLRGAYNNVLLLVADASLRIVNTGGLPRKAAGPRAARGACHAGDLVPLGARNSVWSTRQHHHSLVVDQAPARDLGADVQGEIDNLAEAIASGRRRAAGGNKYGPHLLGLIAWCCSEAANA